MAGGVLGGIFNKIFGAVAGTPAVGASDVMTDVGAASVTAGAEIPTFARGGLVTRPTLAMVGDVPEVITPLSAMGGGGPPISITVQAIDTQTGIDFLLKNRRAVAQALSAAMAGNATVGRRSR